MKAVLITGLLLMLTAGMALIVCLALRAEMAQGIEEDIFTAAQLTKGMAISVVVFFLAFGPTSFSAIFLGMDLWRNLKKQEKWRKRI